MLPSHISAFHTAVGSLRAGTSPAPPITYTIAAESILLLTLFRLLVVALERQSSRI